MRKLLSAVLLLCASVCAFPQGATIPFQPAVTQQGNFLSFAVVTFCSLPTTINTLGVCQTPVTVFKDQGLTLPYSSAIQTDGIGYFPPNSNTATSIWFTPGTYCYTLTVSSMTSPATNPCVPFTISFTANSGSLTVPGNITQTQGTAATNVANQSSFLDCMNASYWTGAISATDQWCFQDVLGTGANPTSTFTLTHGGSPGSSGAATFSIPGNVSVGGTLGAKSINNVQKVEKFSGATADAQIAACLAAIPTGGICDARGYGATTQSLAVLTTVGADQTLVFDPATKFQAATSSLNLFKVQLNGKVKGFTFDCGNQPSYTGILFQNDTTQFYTNGNDTEIADIKTSTNCSGVTGFTSLKLSSTSVSLGVAFLKIHGWRIWGGADGMFFTTSGTGFVDGVHLIDMIFSNQAHGWHITGVASGTIAGNICAACSYEKDSVGVNGILIDGAAAADLDGNTWFGDIWDTTVPIAITNPNAAKNTFYGRFDGTWSDNTAQLNNFFDGGNAVALPTIAVQGVQVKVNAGGTNNALDLFDITASAATPHKYLRVASGSLQVINSAFSTNILGLSDTGLLTVVGGEDMSGGSITNVGTEVGPAGNPVVIKGGSGAASDLIINNVANSKNLWTFNDTGTVTVDGTSSGTMTISPPAAASGTLNLPAVGAGTVAQVIGSGTVAMTTAGILTGACGTTVTVAATGVATTDVITVTRNAAATIGNGGGLTLNAWPTSGNVNFNYCNSSAGTITPTAMTVNWNVVR